MSTEREDRFKDERLLDGCLDEVLGGRTPPDLTARILQAWAMRRQNSLESASDTHLLLPPLPGPAVETLPVEIAPPETQFPGVPLSTTVVRAVGSAENTRVETETCFAPVRRSRSPSACSSR